MRVRLIGRTGMAAGLEQPVPDLLTLGSGAGSGLRIESRSLSRQHAQIVKSGDTYYLEDLGSRSGTFLNGQRITRFPIRNLDVVSLGPDIDLIFVVQSGAQPAEGDGHTVAAPREPAIAPLMTPAPRAPVTESPTLSAPREAAAGLPNALTDRARAARRGGDLTLPMPDSIAKTPAPSTAAIPHRPRPAGTGSLLGVVLDGPTMVRLNLGSFDIGRHPDADVVVMSRDVGRRHARLHVQAEGVQLEDLQTANGTFVDDVAITGVAAVPDGSRIRFATVEFAIMYVRGQVQKG